MNLWAPTFTPEGEVALGLGLTRQPQGRPPQRDNAGDLLELAEHVTALATT